jgi:hypothetical protein
VKNHVVLEKQAENILKQGCEVGQKHAAVLFQLAKRRGFGAQGLPDAAVVGIVFNPTGI